MPLFIAISGYFSNLSTKKLSFQYYLLNRFLYLLTPMILWSLMDSLIHFIFLENMSPFMLCKAIIYRTGYYYWFIWAILIFSLLTTALNKLKIDNTLILILSVFIITLLPFKILNFQLIKSMYPFFIIGYILATKDIRPYFMFCRKYLLVFILISITCYLFWSKNTYAYITPSSLGEIKTTIFRLLASISISISFLIVLFLVYERVGQHYSIITLSNVGQETLGLYLMQWPFFLYLSSCHIALLSGFSILCVIPSVIFLIVGYLIILILNKYRITRFLLLGKKH